jgi:hypothetical protein
MRTHTAASVLHVHACGILAISVHTSSCTHLSLSLHIHIVNYKESFARPCYSCAASSLIFGSRLYFHFCCGFLTKLMISLSLSLSLSHTHTVVKLHVCLTYYLLHPPETNNLFRPMQEMLGVVLCTLYDAVHRYYHKHCYLYS